MQHIDNLSIMQIVNKLRANQGDSKVKLPVAKVDEAIMDLSIGKRIELKSVLNQMGLME